MKEWTLNELADAMILKHSARVAYQIAHSHGSVLGVFTFPDHSVAFARWDELAQAILDRWDGGR